MSKFGYLLLPIVFCSLALVFGIYLVKKSNWLRPIALIVFLLVGGGIIYFGYFASKEPPFSIFPYIIMILGGLLILLGGFVSLFMKRSELRGKDDINKSPSQLSSAQQLDIIRKYDELQKRKDNSKLFKRQLPLLYLSGYLSYCIKKKGM